MPSLKKYPCESCDYIGINRRMLSRHVAIIHSKKVFRCPLCPFVTRYAANWYRHKRQLHGLSKMSTCQVCGFFANSTQDLAQHKAEHHSEYNIIGDGHDVKEQRIETDVDPYLFQLSPVQSTAELNESLVFQNYQNANSFNGYGDVSTEIAPHNDSVTFSLPLDGQLLENYVTSLPSAELKSQPSLQESPPTMNSCNNSTNLKPLKIRRSYCCNSCGFLTGSPREFLYHQRDIHSMRMNIFECELCIYASKHIQKLQRHYGLVHRQKKSFEDKTSTPVKNSVGNKTATVKKNDPPLASNNSSFAPTNHENPPVTAQKTPRVRKERPGLFKCSACTYHTRNKVLMAHHEKTVHFKKKFFRCLQCGYVTNEKARYTKHVKYHNLSKMQCEFCHFKSAYKWNMERHMRNHMTGTNGEYNCTLCNFVTNSKQSLKFHASNHHDLESTEYDDSQEIEPENEITSDKSGQMVVDNADWMNSDVDEFANADSSNMELQSIESANTGWEAPPQDCLPTLRCTLCNFATTWPFELKKHEEMHRCDKKHACPMCGMRFEHIAWLTKHLHRVHSENSEAQNLAAAYELMKPPARRRPTTSIPQKSRATSTPKPILPKIKAPASPKQSLLSSYLKGSAVPKFSYSPPKEEMLKNALKQPESQFNFSVPSATTSAHPKKKSVRHVNSCTKCSYKTKWGSELQRHMRVHNDEKPFHCPRCSYHSKWKGDLTRHIAKYHGCKLPISNKAMPLPKLRLKKAIPNQTMSQNNWENVSEEMLVKERSKDPNAKDQDSPLDLTISKTNIFQPSFSRMNGFRADVLTKERRGSGDSGQSSSNSTANSSYLNMLLTSDKFGAKLNVYPQLADNGPKPPVIKKKYFCPFCSFSTSTPSRFHIHIVQHYNKRPFMCSVCGHNSNWEWDITKHIRLKGGKDKEHRNACVLLTDESGRRNYEKYEKYLKVVRSKTLSKSTKPPARTTTTLTKTRGKWQDNSAIPHYSSPPNTTVVSEMAPENIIVTPDLPFPQEVAEKIDAPEATLITSEPNWSENNVDLQNGNFKFFLCKHCNYKHSQKKVVISHLTVHAGVRPFRCRVCGLTSCWRNVIVQHVKTLHNGYMNDVEDRITYIQEGFVIRITSVKSSNKFSTLSSGSRKAMFNCKFCPYKCEKEVYIKFHMKQHKPKEGAIYQCSYCPYYVKFKRTLVKHLKLHEAPETPVSIATFSNPDEVPEIIAPIERDDISLPIPDYSYQQNEVQQDYAEEDSIRIAYDQLRSADHTPERNVDCMPESSLLDPQTPKRKRNKTKKHVCENCPYRTDNRTQYLYHKQFHRPNASARFKCTICTYWATMQHLLTQHMKVHNISQEDSFHEEEEMTYSSLPEHNPQYSGFGDIMPVMVERDGLVTEMFKCRHCPMMSKKKANVKIHERSHGRNENDGQFACNFCSYKSTGQGGLTNHMKMYHTWEQEQQFDNEENSFASDLMPMMRKKVFSYFCMRCPAVFKSSSDLFIHKTFHGSSLPFPCPHCDYRAKHKIHLQKHLQVHTDAYVSKRDASFGPPLNNEDNHESQHLHNGAKSVNQPQSTKKIDQMLLLELAEVKTFLRNSKVKGRQQKCTFCPAAFSKAAILVYHLSLHGSSGEFGCSQCDYATTRSANLAAHVQVHGKITSPTKRLSRVFACPNCPAVFEKNDRFERHLNLHGQNYRFACEHCDYSVNCAANLAKHRLVHEKAEPAIASGSDNEPDDTIPLIVAPNDSAITLEPLEELDAANRDKLRSPETGEDRKAYLCDRCPYFQMRKDAVINHQNRHWQREGLLCSYCDYRVIGLTFLQNHVKSHVLPTNVFAAEIYAKFNKFDISYKDKDDNKIVLFEDKGTEIPIHERFFPVLEDDSILNPPSVSLEESLTIEENADDGSVDETTDENLRVSVEESGMDIEDNNEDDALDTEGNNEDTLDSEGNNEDASDIEDNNEDASDIGSNENVSDVEDNDEDVSDTEDNDEDVSDTEDNDEDVSDTEDNDEDVSDIDDDVLDAEDNENVLDAGDNNGDVLDREDTEDVTDTESDQSVTDTENNIESVLDTENNRESTDDIAPNSQENFVILANEVIPKKYLPKVILKDIFLEKKSTDIQTSNLHMKKSCKTSNHSYQSDTVNKPTEKKNKSKSKSYSTSSCSQSEEGAPSTSGKSSIKIKIKVANVNKDNCEKSLYSIFNKNTDEVDVASGDSCDETSAVPDTQKLPKIAEADPETSSNSNGIKVSEENIMDVQTDDGSLTADCSDANCISDNNNMTEKHNDVFKNTDECSSFKTFPDPLGLQVISDSGDEKHPQDILKQLNSMVNGVCTNLPQI